MKRLILVLSLLLLLLSGCKDTDVVLNRAMILRENLLVNKYTFDAVVTADYQDKIYTFKMHCISGSDGEIYFETMEPQSVGGITGSISNDGGKLTFDNQALMFPLLVEELPSPVSAPWLFTRALRGGYISSCNSEEHGFSIQIDDSYGQSTLMHFIKINENDIPYFAEIYWNGKRIITISVENFNIL